MQHLVRGHLVAGNRNSHANCLILAWVNGRMSYLTDCRDIGCQYQSIGTTFNRGFVSGGRERNYGFAAGEVDPSV